MSLQKREPSVQRAACDGPASASRALLVAGLLVAGLMVGCGGGADQEAPRAEPVADMNASHEGFATFLVSGPTGPRVLAVQLEASSVRLESTDAVSIDRWVASAAVPRQRSLHAQATELADGTVLLTGKSSVPTDGGAERYLPLTDTLVAAGPRRRPDVFCAAAVRMADGRVMLAGGSYRPEPPMFTLTTGSTAAVEIYDPRTDTWTAAASLRGARRDASATLLADGRVLVAGGVYNRPALSGSDYFEAVYLATAEIYDPQTNTWTAAASLPRPRYDHRGQLLADGTVLLIGGAGCTTSEGEAGGTLDRYDPALNTWELVGCSRAARRFHPTGLSSAAAAVVTLPDSQLLIIGSGRIDRFDPAGSIGRALAPIPAEFTSRRAHAATLLPDGSLLLCGGNDQTNEYLPNGSTLKSCERVRLP